MVITHLRIVWVGLAIALAAACSYDYDSFKFTQGSGDSSTGLSGPGSGGIGTGGAPVGPGGGGSAGFGGGACPSGSKSCNGGCVAIDDPEFGCAPDGCTSCSIPNAVSGCSAGACTLASCAPGFGNCDGDPANGCELDVSTDAHHCGSCGRICSAFHTASIECAGGLCVSACDSGWANCDEPTAPAPDNGCELNVAQNNSNCGGCGNACSMQGNVADASPFVCDGGPRPKNHCGCSADKRCQIGTAGGSCNKATGRCTCGADTCSEGEACVDMGGNDVCSCNGGAACAPNEACCEAPSGCLDLSNDATNCGACGHHCPSGFSCQGGTCVCTLAVQCNAGTAGSYSCSAGICRCDGSVCSVGERCLEGGDCG